MKISNKLFFLSIALLIGNVSVAQKPNYEWAGSMGGSDYEQGNSIIVDKSGNVYSTGLFMNKADFDPDASDTAYLTSNGGYDIYILKLDSKGKFVWVVNIGDASDYAGNSINLDASGDVYITGYFQGSVDFDPGKAKTVLSSAGGSDIFVCKFDASGNFVWASQMGGNGEDVGNGIDLDANGNVFTTGYFTETADFDPDGKATADITTYGSTDIFVSRLDSKGNYTWAGQMGGAGDDVGYGIALDSIGYVFTTGSFMDKANFDPDPTSSGAFLTSTNDADIFVSKLNVKGTYSWAHLAGDKGFDEGRGIVVDALGNSYTTGYFFGSPDFDPATPIKGNRYEYFLANNGDYDIFVWKLNAAGLFVWAKNMGGSDFDMGLSIALDESKNVYTTGVFSDVADFDPSSSNTANLTSSGWFDVFLSKLDVSGNYVWGLSVGSSDDEFGTSIVVDKLKSVYTTGFFVSTVDFDPGSGTQNLSSAGDYDAFVLKLSTCKASMTDLKVSACNSYFYNGSTYYKSGDFTKILKNSTGCDSIVNIKLTVNTSSIGTLYVGACNSYTLNGQTYTTAGTYNQTLTNTVGCDSFLVLELKFLTSSSTVNAKACNSYTSNGKTYTTSGKYTQVIKNVAGCDSIITLNLSVFNTSASINNITACDEYSMNGKTYTVSGTYYQTIMNNASCDSNITLNLKINNSSAYTMDKVSCVSFTLNAQTYIKSGTYIQTLKNKKGCDSIITLNLAINNTASSITTTECQSYKLNSQTYKETGIYIQTIPNAKGCDSTITLDLTIKKVVTTVTQVGPTLTADATSSFYQWVDCNNGNANIPGEIYQSFTPTLTGNYSVKVTKNNCTDNSSCYNVKVGKVGNTLNNSIQVFPNPASGQANVVLGNSLNNGTIKLINISGQTMQILSNLTGTNFSINLSEQAKGIYYIEISENGNVSRVKLVKN